MRTDRAAATERAKEALGMRELGDRAALRIGELGAEGKEGRFYAGMAEHIEHARRDCGLRAIVEGESDVHGDSVLSRQLVSRMRYRDKAAARKAVWDTLSAKKAARFPFPPHGRIPNFAGARQAAERLLAHPLFQRVRVIKVNPDSPQRWVRQF